MKNQDNHLQQDRKAKETGNVFFIILIALMLLLGLSRAVIKDSGGGASIGDKGQVKIAASQILKYVKSVENTIKQLQLINGCSEEEINFGANDFPYHNNTDAPSDDSCDVFSPKGGALNAPLNPPLGGQFSGGVAIEGFGSARAELLYKQQLGSNLALCNALNEMSNITYSTGAPPQDRTPNSSFTPFGQYDYNNAPTQPARWIGEGGASETGSVIFANKQSGCYTLGTTGKHYIFYHVLLAR